MTHAQAMAQGEGKAQQGVWRHHPQCAHLGTNVEVCEQLCALAMAGLCLL